MRQLPALFSTPMVQAIMENRKKMTRRTAGLEKINENPNQWRFDKTDDFESDVEDLTSQIYFEKLDSKGEPTEDYKRVFPRYNVGDQIWVKETFFEPVLHDGFERDYYYKADYPNGITADFDSKYITGKWKPSLFMPKAAARIWLEVTDVRCERLQDITEADAIAEGVEKRKNNLFVDYLKPKEYVVHAVVSFLRLWEKINGRENTKLNPWVFVYTFKRIEKPC